MSFLAMGRRVPHRNPPGIPPIGNPSGHFLMETEWNPVILQARGLPIGTLLRGRRKGAIWESSS
eukprot:3887657-Pyramimonas_sp.AAC.1